MQETHLPKPCRKTNMVGIKIPKEYQAGLARSQHHLHGRVILQKVTSLLKTDECKSL